MKNHLKCNIYVFYKNNNDKLRIWPPRCASGGKKIWFLGLGPPKCASGGKKSFLLIFRLLLNAFWHAGKRDLVESFPDHRSDLKKVHYTSSYGQNTPKKETWSQCRVLLFWAHFFFGNAFNGSPGFRLRPPSSFGKFAGK